MPRAPIATTCAKLFDPPCHQHYIYQTAFAFTARLPTPPTQYTPDHSQKPNFQFCNSATLVCTVLTIRNPSISYPFKPHNFAHACRYIQTRYVLDLGIMMMEKSLNGVQHRFAALPSRCSAPKIAVNARRASRLTVRAEVSLPSSACP